MEKSKRFSFRYHFLNGRIFRKLVSKSDSKFKVDNINSCFSDVKSNVRIGSRKQRYTKAPERSLSFFHKNNKLFDSNDVDLSKGVNVVGCFDTNRSILERTAIPEFGDEFCHSLPNSANLKMLKKSLKATVRKLKIETLETPMFDSVLNCKFKPNTKAGFSAEYICGFKNKKESVDVSMLSAKRIWNRLNVVASDVEDKKIRDRDERLDLCVDKMGDIPGRGFYDIGARNKRDLTFDEGELCASRVVHMPEFHNEIVMAPWIDSITDFIKIRNSGPIYIGNSISDFTRLERDLNNGKYYIEGDWKRFDSTLYARICIMAVGILRQFYHPKDVKADVFMLFLADRIICKDYFFPGGKFVRFIHGLPSGTKSTSLLGSIINLLCLNYCLEDFDCKNFNFAVGGDDFLVISRIELNSTQLDIINERSKNIGMIFKFLKFKYQNAKYLNDMPSFYKYIVKGGEPCIKIEDVLQRIFFPWNKNYDTPIKYFNFLEDQFCSIGYPNTALIPFYSIYCNLHNSLKICIKPISIVDVYLKHKELYRKYIQSFAYNDDGEESVPLFNFLCSTTYSQNLYKSDQQLCTSNLVDVFKVTFSKLDLK